MKNQDTQSDVRTVTIICIAALVLGVFLKKTVFQDRGKKPFDESKYVAAQLAEHSDWENR